VFGCWELGHVKADLGDDRLSGAFWLRIPVGKLHNDRSVPLHPALVELIDNYRARQVPSPSGHLVARNDGRPFHPGRVPRSSAGAATITP
jgi:hypothetical protein